jgi:CRP-like cAMP-binding protein
MFSVYFLDHFIIYFDQTGDYFGENALLASKPRQGTVKATGKNGTLKLLYVERTTFNRILGSIEDILRRNQSY